MLEIGQKGPDFTLPGVDGKNYTLAELVVDNQAVAVTFSCNHCPYVRAWEDRMKAIQRDYKDKGFVLAAINANDAVKYPEDDFEHMKQRADQENFNFLYLRDDTQQVAHAYGGTHTPHVFLLDGNGVLQYRGAIDDNHDDPDAVQQHYLRDALDAVLAGKAPATTASEAKGCTIKWK
jgi:peroxiredoxin